MCKDPRPFQIRKKEPPRRKIPGPLTTKRPTWRAGAQAPLARPWKALPSRVTVYDGPQQGEEAPMLRWFWAVLATLLLVGACSRIPTSDPPPIPEFLLPQGDRRPVEVVFASPKSELRETPEGALIT